MHTLRVLSSRGDTAVTWELDAEAAVREAERIFNEERIRGATAFKVEAGKAAERLDAFDKTAEQIVIVPRIAGG